MNCEVEADRQVAIPPDMHPAVVVLYYVTAMEAQCYAVAMDHLLCVILTITVTLTLAKTKVL